MWKGAPVTHTSSWPFVKTSRHFGGNLIFRKNNNEVRSLFKKWCGRSLISRVLVYEGGGGSWQWGWGGGEGSGWGLHHCFLNGCQESLMALEFGQEKSGLEVSEEAGICGSRSTSVCVLLDWLLSGHCEEERQALFHRSTHSLRRIKRGDTQATVCPPPPLHSTLILHTPQHIRYG